MVEFDEDLSPVLLIIRDTNEHVFGAVVSGAIRPSDHYTGSIIEAGGNKSGISRNR